MPPPPRKTCYLLYKPYGVVSRFTPEAAWLSLKVFGPFKEGVYPIGRLDADSEGLLFLTDDRFLTHRLTDPAFEHPKTYMVQVDRIPDEEDLARLRGGVLIEGKMTRPAEVRLLPEEPVFPPRPVPVRFRKNVPTAWIEQDDRSRWPSDAAADPYPCWGIYARRSGAGAEQGIVS